MIAAQTEPTAAPRPLRMSSTMRRTLRILLAAGRPVRTRGLARIASPHAFADIQPTDTAALRKACGHVAAEFGRLRRLGLIERTVVMAPDGNRRQPWRLTAAGVAKALELQPWSLDVAGLEAAEGMVLS
jgi:hypothetical protein